MERLLACHLSIYGALVAYALLGEAAVVVVVDVAEVRPQTEEALLQFRLDVVAEVGEEALQHLFLLVVEIRYVVELVNVLKVAEYAVGVCHVLVDVVEVGKQQLSPAVEVVERLVDARTLRERLVYVADELYRVGWFEVGMLAEEVADSDVGWAPYGLTRNTCKVLVEEQSGALVREHHGDAREVGAVLADYIFCDIF